jgi:hypothetical protein
MSTIMAMSLAPRRHENDHCQQTACHCHHMWIKVVEVMVVVMIFIMTTCVTPDGHQDHHHRTTGINILPLGVMGTTAVDTDHYHHRIILIVIRPIGARQEIETVLPDIRHDVIQCGAPNHLKDCLPVHRR